MDIATTYNETKTLDGVHKSIWWNTDSGKPNSITIVMTLSSINDVFLNWVEKNKDRSGEELLDFAEHFGAEIEPSGYVYIWHGEVSDCEHSWKISTLKKLKMLWDQEQDDFKKDPAGYKMAIERGEKVFNIEE